MGIIYSVGMTKNSFDVAPEHGRTPFYVDSKHDGADFNGYRTYHGRITVYSKKPKDAGY